MTKTVRRDATSLTIELEDAATRSVLTSMAGLLGAGVQMWHFVALSGDQVAYRSETFAAPYSWGTLPIGKTMLPREEWAPGMSEALDGLRAEIARDGWVEGGHGDLPWQQDFHR